MFYVEPCEAAHPEQVAVSSHHRSPSSLTLSNGGHGKSADSQVDV